MIKQPERREADERIFKLEIICEQNTQSIHELSETFKVHLKEDHSQHAEIREAMVNMSNGINTLSKSVSDLRSVVENQQNDIMKGQLWQQLIIGMGVGGVFVGGAVWAIFKFVVGAG